MDEQLKEKASSAVSEASDQARGVASTSADQAGQVADTAKTQVKEVSREVAAQGQAMLDETAKQLRHQADVQTQNLAGGVRRVADQARALADGRPHEAGPLQEYAVQAADQLSGLAQRVESRGLDGLVDDTQRFARRRPGVFLLGAAVAGFAAGRLLRGATASSGADTSPQGPQAPPALQSGFVPAASVGR